jgi:hypothetical protein
LSAGPPASAPNPFLAADGAIRHQKSAEEN